MAEKKVRPDYNVYAKTAGVYSIGVSRPSKLNYKILKALRQEATIKISLLVPELITRTRIKNYVNETYPEIQKFIRDNLNHIKFKKIMRQLFTYRWVGASIGELVYEYREGKVSLKDIIVLHPDTWFTYGIKENEIQQIGGNTIPREKCIININEDEFGQGASILEGDC